MLVWLGAAAYTLTRGGWAGTVTWEVFEVDLLSVMIAYLFAAYGQVPATLFALGQGFFMDLYAGGLKGLFGFLYLITYAGIHLSSRFFHIQSVSGQIMIVAQAVLVKKIMFFVLLKLTSQGRSPELMDLWHAALAALTTGLVTPLVFSVLGLPAPAARQGSPGAGPKHH